MKFLERFKSAYKKLFERNSLSTFVASGKLYFVSFVNIYILFIFSIMLYFYH